MPIKNLKYVIFSGLMGLSLSFSASAADVFEDKKGEKTFVSLKNTADDWLILSESLVQNDSVEAFKRWDEVLSQYPDNIFLLEQDFIYSLGEGALDRAIVRGEAYVRNSLKRENTSENQKIIAERKSIIDILKIIKEFKANAENEKLYKDLENIKNTQDIALIVSLIMKIYLSEESQQEELLVQLEKSFPQILSRYIRLQNAYFDKNPKQIWEILQDNRELYALIEANDMQQIVDVFSQNNQQDRAKEAQLQWVRSIKNRNFFKIEEARNLNDAALHQKMAQSFMMLGRIYTSAFQDNPNFRNQLMYHMAQYLDPQNPFIDYNLARSYLSLNHNQKAKDILGTLLDISAVSARAKYDFGYILEQDEDYKQALNLYRQLSQDFPLDISILEKKADIYRMTENFEACTAILDNAIDLAKKQYPVNMNIDKDGKEEALPEGSISTDIPQQALYLVFARGICYERLNHWEKAEPDLIWAAEQAPETPFILNYLAYSWADRGYNLDEAEKMLKIAIDKFPNDGNIADSLGWVYFRKNQLDAAEKWINFAANLEPNQGEILDHLGDVLWWQGKKRQAFYAWQRVVDVDSQSPAAERAAYKLKIKKPIQIPGRGRIDFPKEASVSVNE